MQYLQRIVSWFLPFLSKIHWHLFKRVTEDELQKIHELMTPHYYVVLTRRKNHLSTWMVQIAHLFLTGRWGYWSHVLMNLEDEVTGRGDHRMVEAIGTGIVVTPFEEVFNCSSVMLLKPKGISLDEFTKAMDEAAKGYLGRPYDNLFDLKNDNALSCVELVRAVLKKSVPDYDSRFSDLERMIAKYKNLDPQMFADCTDFEVVYETKH